MINKKLFLYSLIIFLFFGIYIIANFFKNLLVFILVLAIVLVLLYFLSFLINKYYSNSKIGVFCDKIIKFLKDFFEGILGSM